jgi:hypothetical protein
MAGAFGGNTLSQLNNNQTNLQWRNAINTAFTTLEAVSAQVVVLSAQNPDTTSGLLVELSGKAGSKTGIWGQVNNYHASNVVVRTTSGAIVAVSGVAKSALSGMQELSGKTKFFFGTGGAKNSISGAMLELSGKVGKGKPLSASLSARALSANTKLATRVDVDLTAGNEFVLSGKNGSDASLVATTNYKTSGISLKVVSGFIDAVPSIRIAKNNAGSQGTGISNFVGGASLNTDFNYNGTSGIMDLQAIRGSAQAIGVSADFGIALGNNNAVKSSKSTSIGYNNDVAGSEDNTVIGVDNKTTATRNATLLGKKNVNSYVDGISLGFKNSGFINVGQRNLSGGAGRSIAFGLRNSGTGITNGDSIVIGVANNYGTSAINNIVVGRDNVIGATGGGNATLGNNFVAGRLNTVTSGGENVVIGKGNMLRGFPQDYTGSSTGSSIVIGTNNTTSGSQFQTIIGHNNKVISGTTGAVGGANVNQHQAFNVTIGSKLENSFYGVNIGLENTVSGAGGIILGRKNKAYAIPEDEGTIIIGYQSSATGVNDKQILIGNNLSAASDEAINIGHDNVVFGSNSAGVQAAISIGKSNTLRTSRVTNSIQLGHSLKSPMNLGTGTFLQGNLMLGNDLIVSGITNRVFGHNNVISGAVAPGSINNTLIGSGSVIQGRAVDSSILIGTNSMLSADNSIVIGNHNTLSGSANVAAAQAKQQVVIGHNNAVSGQGNSILIGNNNIGMTSGAVVIGNNIYKPVSAHLSQLTNNIINVGARNILRTSGFDGSILLGHRVSGAGTIIGQENTGPFNKVDPTRPPVIIGTGNTSNATFSGATVIGQSNDANGSQGAVVIGDENAIKGGFSTNFNNSQIAIGSQNRSVTGSQNILLGNANVLNSHDHFGISIGQGNETSGATKVIRIGYQNKDFHSGHSTISSRLSAVGESISIGSANRTDYQGITLGFNNVQSGKGGIAIGHEAKINGGDGSVAIGTALSSVHGTSTGGSIAIGGQIKNLGTNAGTKVSIGRVINNDNAGGIAIGNSIRHAGNDEYGESIAIGLNVSAMQSNQILIGQHIGNHDGNSSRANDINTQHLMIGHSLSASCDPGATTTANGALIIGQNTRVQTHSRNSGRGAKGNGAVVAIGTGSSFIHSELPKGSIDTDERGGIIVIQANDQDETSSLTTDSRLSGGNNVFIGRKMGIISGAHNVYIGSNGNNTGEQADLSGTFNVVIGASNIDNGNFKNSVAVGRENQQTAGENLGGYATLLGQVNRYAAGGANAQYALGGAVGYGNVMKGQYNFVAGAVASGTGVGSLAIGYQPSAGGTGSIALGTTVRAGRKASIGVGYTVHASGENTAVFGSYGQVSTSGVTEIGQWKAHSTGAVRRAVVRCQRPVNTVNSAVSAVNGMGSVCFTLPVLSAGLTDGGAAVSALGGNTEALTKLPRNMISLRRKGRNVILDLNINGTMYGIDLGTAKVNVATRSYGTSATGSSDGA